MRYILYLGFSMVLSGCLPQVATTALTAHPHEISENEVLP